jgi:DNA-binding XRE family transcriptional regulator
VSLFRGATPEKRSGPEHRSRDSPQSAVEANPSKHTLKENENAADQLRTKAGLTQAQLAKLVGTTASVICRLGDADYEGHSVAMLRRIAAALNRRVEIRFLPLPRSA